MKFRPDPRSHWVALYVLINIIGAIVMLGRGKLIGDLDGNPLFSEAVLLLALALVCGSYIIVLGPVFDLVGRVKVVQLNFGGDYERVGRRIGFLLIILQVGFLVFNLIAGVNLAGSNSNRSSNPFALIWVAVPVDALFLVYYGFYRDNRFFFPNLVIWIISNMIRGWSGMFLFVVFFEWCRAYRRDKITWPVVLSTATIGVLLYPILTNLKWVIRISSVSGYSIDSFVNAFSENLTGEMLPDIIMSGVEHFIGRLQVTSIVVEVIRIQSYVQSEFALGHFTPFWLEGLHGIFIQKSLLDQEFLPIGVAFTQYGDFGWQSDVLGDWNTNIGYVGWFFIAPYLIPLYILYTVFLGFIAIVLAKMIGWNETAKDMVWLAWLVYLMPPWFASFITVIQAMMIFLVMKLVCSGLKKYPCI